VAELVAEECKGLPLALKVIGGSMVGKTTPQEWQYQLNCLQQSRALPDQKEEEELFGRLKLSYDNLDTDSPVCKECFLGFAAFPEDCVVDMEDLIPLWKGQGLLDDPTNFFGDDPTLSAYYLVGLLIARSLIELTLERHTLSRRFNELTVERHTVSCRYKVHDVMRDLALHIIEGQRPITCLYQPGKKLEEFPADWIRTCERQPCEVCNLSLTENDLTTLNGVTFSAPKLQVLLLANNWKLETLQKKFLKGIENLKVLDLSHCRKLKSLPREIGNLRQLTHLNLHACRGLKSLPQAIGKLTQLTHLHLHQCEKLKSLPEMVGKFTQLIHLDLSYCFRLEKLPDPISHLQSLQWLNLAFCNSLKYLPSTMGDLRSLQYLYLEGPSAFAVDICKLTGLTELTIFAATCEIVEICDQQLKLVKLKIFKISGCHQLRMLPNAIQSIVNLESFYLCYCERIRILPSFITLFSKLKVLDLQGMSSLESLPALNTLKMLTTLSIQECRSIKKLPNSFTSSNAFPNLEKLDCLRSGLVEFPKVEDGAMPNLRKLNLDGTWLNSLPDTLIYLKNLKVVNIRQERFDDLCKKFDNSWLSRKSSLIFKPYTYSGPHSHEQYLKFNPEECNSISEV
jgi:Leucine-rich repeat (LRR) protein